MKTIKYFLYLATLVALVGLLWPAALSAQEDIVCEKDVMVLATRLNHWGAVVSFRQNFGGRTKYCG